MFLVTYLLTNYFSLLFISPGKDRFGASEARGKEVKPKQAPGAGPPAHFNQ